MDLFLFFLWICSIWLTFRWKKRARLNNEVLADAKRDRRDFLEGYRFRKVPIHSMTGNHIIGYMSYISGYRRERIECPSEEFIKEASNQQAKYAMMSFCAGLVAISPIILVFFGG